jgi:hypothetical protein
MIKLFDRGGKPYLTCAASDKARPAKPEEIIRQLYLRKLISVYGYPKAGSPSKSRSILAPLSMRRPPTS